MNNLLDSIYLKHLYCTQLEMKFEESNNLSITIFPKLPLLFTSVGKIAQGHVC